MDMLDSKFVKLSSRTVCQNRVGGKELKCNCLSLLSNHYYRRLVSRWSLPFFERCREDQNQEAMNSIRYAMATKEKKEKPFLIPFDNSTTGLELEWDPGAEEVELTPLLGNI